MRNCKFRNLISSFMAIFLIAVGLPGLATAKVKVGFVYLTTPGDHGWTYAHEVGRQDVIKHFGDKVETTFVENVPEGPDATRVIDSKQGNEIILQRPLVIWILRLRLLRSLNVKFEHITGYKDLQMLPLAIFDYMRRYVQGIVAGMMTKSNKIGYIASFPIPEVIQGINAFGLVSGQLIKMLRFRYLGKYMV